MHDPIMRALLVARRYADGGRAPELNPYDPPWYDKAAYAISDYLYGPEARAPETQWVKKLVGPENPFNVPAMATEAGRTIGHGLNTGDPATVGLGSAVAAMAAMPSAKGATAALKRVRNPIRAYHGSPHDFDKFDMSKIETGEGAQAFGHGLYFAENEGVARSYRDTNAGKGVNLKATVEAAFPERSFSTNDLGAIYSAANHGDKDPIKAARAVQMRLPELRDHGPFNGPAGPNAEKIADAITQIRDQGRGRMYEVNLHASPDDFLDWDKPLSQQSEKVRASIESIGTSHRPISGFRGLSNDENGLVRSEAREYAGDPSSLDRNIEMWTSAFNKRQSDGHTFDAANAAQRLSALQKAKSLGAIVDRRISDTVSDLINNLNGNTSGLREAGIPGIRYLDQGSRDKAFRVDLETSRGPYNADAPLTFSTHAQAKNYADRKAAEGFKTNIVDQGSRNYVVFDPAMIEILRKHGILGTLGGTSAYGAFNAPPAEAKPVQ